MKEICLPQSYDEYLSLADILTMDEKVSTTIAMDFAGLGFIHSNNDSADLKAGTTLDLPLWLAEALQRLQDEDRNSFASLKLPPAFQSEARKVLSADPSVVDLRREASARCSLRFSENFYALGLHIAPFAAEEHDIHLPNGRVTKTRNSVTEEVRRCMANTFQYRFSKIMIWSNDVRKENPTQFSFLDRSEIQLLKIAKAEQTVFVDWMERKANILRPSLLAPAKQPRNRMDVIGGSRLRKRVRVN